ncbi:MAG: DUF1080 domain-containing protein [Planctomycetaceae bacterium]|nr:DUF1080 domain-containing protein [Planctomycetaceae bacterium]
MYFPKLPLTLTCLPLVLGMFAIDCKAQPTAADEFTQLFNGENLTGWVNVNCAPSTWTVKDGVIHCTGKPIGELRTERMYQNFVLELEWRHLKPKGNAGVFVWADALPARGQPFHRAIEVQVLDGREADWYTSDGDIFPIHGATMVPKNGRGGSRAFPTEKRSKPSPEWNHYRIECIDGSIKLAVNGKVVTEGSECNPRKGYICLESEGSPAEFRNIRLKELPATSIPPTQIAKPAEGFISLYNGVNLDGWKMHPGLVNHWKPNDWRLTYDGQATGEDKNLWTQESFGDFQLIVDWRWNGKYEATTKRPVILPSGKHAKNEDGSEKQIDVPIADSGIYLRGSPKGQINIWQWPIGSGEIWGYRTDSGQSDQVRAAATPRLAADQPVGQWNRFLITLIGNRLTVELNGKQVIDQCQLSGLPAEGPIALQHHGDPIEFANIFIKRLD